jgi:hypothetical protein
MCFGLRQQLRDDQLLSAEAMDEDDDEVDDGDSQNIWVSGSEEVRGLAIGYSTYGDSTRKDSKKPCKL